MTSGTSMSNTRGQNGSAHNGTQNAALSVTGNNQGGPSVTNTSEEYNGSGWTSGGTYPISSFGSYGSGVQTAALFSGGRTGSPPFPVTNTSASYNGTSFSAEGNLSTARQSSGCFGATENTSIAAGGHNVPGNYTDTEEYNGSAWTTVPATFPSQDNMGAAGVQTAGIANANGGTGTFLFDGSAWTGGPSMNTARSSLNQAMMGLTQDAVVALGGNPSPNAAIENYDGTSWSTSTATLGTGRSQSASSGNNTAGVMFGGTASTYRNETEEYNKSINVITAAAWSSGGNYPAQYYGLGSSTNGTQNAALGFAGNYPGGFTGNTTSNEYDGSSWTATPAMNTARAYLAGFGTSTAAVAVGGLVPPGATGSNAVEEFTGSWTTGNTIPQAGWNQGACGTLTAGLVAFGTNPAYPGQYALTFEYDGTNWTAANAGPTATNDSKGMGVQTSALFAGGGPPSPEAKQSYEYDGTNWTAGGTLSVDHKAGVTLGSSKDAGIIGGGHTSPQTGVEGYDGTAWSTRPSMATSRGRGGMSGTESSGVVFGGNPSATNATEEWTGETTALNVKTLTQS